MQRHDTDLVAAAVRGDRESMGLLIERELPWVRAVVAGYIRAQSNVDDICQDIFVSAWQGIGKLRNHAGFKSWLYRITINKVRSFIRAQRRGKSTPLVDDVAAACDGGYERREVVQAALEKLSPRYRDPLVIHYLQGKSCAETAEILGLKPVTARIRLLRARQQLAEVLRKDGVV